MCINAFRLHAMSSIQTGRQKRPLFSGQKAFKQFILEEDHVLHPVESAPTFSQRLALAIFLSMLSSGTTLLGIILRVRVVSYIGIVFMFLIILWFAYSYRNRPCSPA